MRIEKAPIYKLSHSKAPKHSKFRLTGMREKPTDFFYSAALESTLAPAFAKVSVPAQSIIRLIIGVDCSCVHLFY